MHNPYAGTEVETTVAGILRGGNLVDEAKTGDSVEIVLPATCFYVESGGQVGDIGRIVHYAGTADGAEIEEENVVWAMEITDARRPLPGLVVHVGKVVKGNPRVGDPAVAEVDRLRRWDIMRNHTATHLLHRELRYVLGEHVQQAGSLVAPDRFRFDFSHNAMLTQDELDSIEQAVNDAVLADFPVTPFEMGYKEAVAGGAMALFTEKYGDRVRVSKGRRTQPSVQPGIMRRDTRRRTRARSVRSTFWRNRPSARGCAASRRRLGTVQPSCYRRGWVDWSARPRICASRPTRSITKCLR